jgi:hypothetical protein
MTLEELRAEVEAKLFDPASFGKDQIDGYINGCVEYIAGMVPLPSLKRIGSVNTVVGQNYVNIGESLDFSGHLKKVINPDSTDPTVYPDLERMYDDYTMDEDGDIEAVTLEGNILYYAKMPEETDALTLIYYTSPARLVRNSDTPSCIPVHCQRKLIVHGTLWMLFDEIENASELEGQKVKTREHYWNSFNSDNRDSGLNDLYRWLGRTRPHHISSVWDF